jgi:hypothetical protein
MRIQDYETNKNLSDVSIHLTRDEASELAAYLQRMLSSPAINRVHLSEIVGSRLEKELTVALEGEGEPHLELVKQPA